MVWVCLGVCWWSFKFCFSPLFYTHGWPWMKNRMFGKRSNSCLKPGAAMDSTLRLLAPLSAETKCPGSSWLLMCLKTWIQPLNVSSKLAARFFGNLYFHLYDDTEGTVVSQVRQLLRCLRSSKILKHSKTHLGSSCGWMSSSWSTRPQRSE